MLYQLSYVHQRKRSLPPPPKVHSPPTPESARTLVRVFAYPAGLKLGYGESPPVRPARLAPREGLEPPTQSLEGSCSVRLSYRGSNKLTELPAIPRYPLRIAHSSGRGRGIRTPDILLPKQVRYQTAPYPAAPGPDPDAEGRK